MDVLMKDKRSLALQLRDRIRLMLKEKYYRAGDRLPSEENLVELFGVSRATVREALKLLEEEKIINVRHGLGRFVTLDPSNLLSEDIARLESVTEMAGELGIQVETEVIGFRREPASEIVSARLGLPHGECVYMLERVRKTGGEAVIFSMDIFPCAIAPDGLDPQLFAGSLMELMEQHWGNWLAYSRATISAEMLTAELQEKIQDDGSVPWILMEQVNYDPHDRPVLYSKDYHRGDKFRFHVLRRRR